MSARRAAFAAVSLALGVAGSFLGAELALRLLHNANFALADLRPVPWGIGSGGIAEYDSVLGYVPKPNATHTWRGGWSASTDARRLRNNGQPTARHEARVRPILAVGDSSAFGDEVEDHESWPAQLERLRQHPVLNAGMGGYGIDQVVLRAERLMPRFEPAIVVLSFVSDDVTRCAFSFRQRWRPYFSLVDGELSMTPPPLPDVSLPESRFEVAMGHSHLARFVLSRVAPSYWNRTTYRRVHDDEAEVAARLLERLGTATKDRGVRLLIVALVGADADVAHMPRLLERARASGIEVLDLTPELLQAAHDPVERVRKFRPHFHPAPETNEWIADRIGDRLASLGWL